MHKIQLTDLEREGLEKHRLAVGTPSQLSDSFRIGMLWSQRHSDEEIRRLKDEVEQLKFRLENWYGE
jgi:hypothetical protein